MRLDVSVADALGVNVGQGSEKLVDVQLDLQRGHSGLHFIEKTRSPIDGLRNEFLDQVEIDLIFLISYQLKCTQIAARLYIHVRRSSNKRPSAEQYWGVEQFA